MLEPTFAHFIGRAAADPFPLRVPMSGARVDAGFPSPAEDFMDDGIDLHEWLVSNQPATFYYRASGISMVLDGICDGDTLIVDRSVQPKDGDLVIATWDG
ncbi:MAG TPA: S24 family peptidase [Thermomonas sp.]|nr:S24 family peptidase [Thermomonas sp.]